MRFDTSPATTLWSEGISKRSLKIAENLGRYALFVPRVRAGPLAAGPKCGQDRLSAAKCVLPIPMRQCWEKFRGGSHSGRGQDRIGESRLATKWQGTVFENGLAQPARGGREPRREGARPWRRRRRQDRLIRPGIHAARPHRGIQAPLAGWRKQPRAGPGDGAIDERDRASCISLEEGRRRSRGSRRSTGAHLRGRSLPCRPWHRRHTRRRPAARW